MCGIFGCIVAEGKAAPLIHESLKRLEYRGYDSVGITTINNGALFTKKDQGKIDDVHRLLNLDDLPGTIGIGHTRWATHGAPLKLNAHPHSDCSGRIVVVHNGIIENFLELKLELESRGHVFVSKTDTEVIPHLVEETLKDKPGLSLADVVREAVKRLEGSYALAVVSANEPDKI
ncbi:glutamine--fructose-6-phosphate aminotransferase, partial [Candidatus Bathyarchaeota archaeon]